MMVWLIAKKEFLINLLTARFIIGFCLCLLLLPFTLIISIDNYRDEKSVHQTEIENARIQEANVWMWSSTRPTVVREPAPLGIFARGIGENMGSHEIILIDSAPLFLSGDTLSRDNPFLNTFFNFDFIKVLAVLLSLLALVFSYDVITRERENGTLKLVFTGNINRVTFLIGKLLGLLLTLVPILLFSYVVAIILLVLQKDIQLTAMDWIGVAFLFFCSLLYLLFFLVLGIFISIKTQSSSSSIIISLVCWIWLLFLMPGVARYLAVSTTETPLYDNLKFAMEDLDKQFVSERNFQIERWKQEGIQSEGYFSHEWGIDEGEVTFASVRETLEYLIHKHSWQFPKRVEYADKKWVLQKEYLDKLERQYKRQYFLSFLTPSEIFDHIATGISQTNTLAYLKYMESVRQYREQVIQYFKDTRLYEKPFWITPGHTIDIFPTKREKEEMDAASFENKMWEVSIIHDRPNINDLPNFIPPSSSLQARLENVLLPISVLIGIIVLFLIWSMFSFKKYNLL